jgi:regulator of protease activity HflC (stomatin/prohibitin superfamily)
MHYNYNLDTKRKNASGCLALFVAAVFFFPFMISMLSEVGVNPFATILIIVAVLSIVTIIASVRINQQWENAVILRLGRYNRTEGPGLFLIIPYIEKQIKRDMRVITMDIPRQEVITKDNISVGVDAVVFMRVVDAVKSVVNIQNVDYAVLQYSQTTLRNIIGQRDLDEVLEKRKEIAFSIKENVDEESDKWGVDVTSIELQNIELPENMKRVMARQAEAEREKRAVIIKSQGEIEAAENLKNAADILMSSAGSVAVKLREFETLSDISYDQSNTIVFYPAGLGSTVENIHKIINPKNETSTKEDNK